MLGDMDVYAATDGFSEEAVAGSLHVSKAWSSCVASMCLFRMDRFSVLEEKLYAFTLALRDIWSPERTSSGP